MIRLAVCAAVWQRYELTAVWWQFLRRLRYHFSTCGIQAGVYVSGNEAEHHRLCLQHAGVWVNCPNKAVGQKYNEAVQAACHDGADYVLILGSDDFMSGGLIERYIDAIASEVTYIGAIGAYYYEPSTNRCAYFPGYPRNHRAHGQSMGAGRLLHRSLMEQRNYRPWPDQQRRGCDAKMHRILHLPKHYLLPIDPDGVLVDVKTDVNIWAFNRLHQLHGMEDVEPEPILSTLPEWQAIRNLGQHELNFEVANG